MTTLESARTRLTVSRFNPHPNRLGSEMYGTLIRESLERLAVLPAAQPRRDEVRCAQTRRSKSRRWRRATTTLRISANVALGETGRTIRIAALGGVRQMQIPAPPLVRRGRSLLSRSIAPHRQQLDPLDGDEVLLSDLQQRLHSIPDVRPAARRSELLRERSAFSRHCRTSAVDAGVIFPRSAV
jgi:hypothetical protein